jgi:hypothetical protein
MKHYSVVISLQAKKDINAFADFIYYQCKQKEIAIQNKKDLYKTITTLGYLADILGYNSYVQAMFGRNARHLRYRKMAIIYTIHGDVV